MSHELHFKFQEIVQVKNNIIIIQITIDNKRELSNELVAIGT